MENNMNYNNDVYANEQATTNFISKVYMTMTLGLLLTSVVAFSLSNYQPWLVFLFENRSIFTFIFIAQIALVFYISATAAKKSTGVLKWFLLYSVTVGVMLSTLFLMYSMEAILYSFGVTGLTFGFMSIVGYTTKKDLTSLGMLLVTLLFGAIIVTILNVFLFKSAGLDLFLSYAMIGIFVGLVAYDTQKMKKIAAQNLANKGGLVVLCALSLYLDFVNIFLYILRIFGNRR